MSPDLQFTLGVLCAAIPASLVFVARYAPKNYTQWHATFAVGLFAVLCLLAAWGIRLLVKL